MIIYLENLQSLISGKEDLAHTPRKSNIESSNKQDDQFLKIVKNITSKGFIRSNYEEKLVDLSDVRINLKSKNSFFFFKVFILSSLSCFFSCF